MSTPVNRTDFKLFKNVTNRIDFLIKTVDKRPATGITSPTIIISDIRERKVVLTSELVEIDASRGHYRLSLPSSAVSGLEATSYRYNVTYSDETDQLVLYSDEFRGVVGYLAVDDGVVGGGGSAIEINRDSFLCEEINSQLVCTSETLRGAAQVNNVNGHQTLAVYSSSFSGKVVVLASLDNSPSETGWYEVGCRKLHRYSGVSGIKFTGNHMWLKIQYSPTSANTGELTKFVLRVD